MTVNREAGENTGLSFGPPHVGWVTSGKFQLYSTLWLCSQNSAPFGKDNLCEKNDIPLDYVSVTEIVSVSQALTLQR